MATRHVRECDRGICGRTLRRPGVRRLMHIVSATVLSLGGMLAAVPAQASTLVGTIPGSFNVNSTGAATYAIPINVPRGSGGLTPAIGLVYNSQSGEGAAGWGWTLSGLSVITRCPKTIDDDGLTEGVALQSTDDYCLDGQRLRVLTGTPGGDATYDTEIRSFKLITSHTDSSTGGPGWWTVETKNGTT